MLIKMVFAHKPLAQPLARVVLSGMQEIVKAKAMTMFRFSNSNEDEELFSDAHNTSSDWWLAMIN